MAFDCHERKPMLYADLFKRHIDMVVQREEENMVISKMQSSSSRLSLSTNQWSSCDSSSSGFSTPLYSDLSEEGDFVAELSRQMAECMLQEEEEEEKENTDANYEDFDASSAVKDNHSQSYDHFGAFNSLKNGLNSNRVSADDDRSPHIQVYELNNQPPVSKEDLVLRERRVKETESAQQKQLQKTEQHFMQYRGRGWGIGHSRHGQSGSGMQAVLLGGSGWRSGSPGTGVFLPRDPTELKRKSGCSMVLMPTRVLQALELHFNRLQDSRSPPPLSGRSPNHSCPKGESTISKGLRNGHSQPANNEEMQLPQEWTY